MKTATTQRPVHAVESIFYDHRHDVTGLHGLLWQILVNGVCDGKQVALTPTYNSAGVLILAVAHESGGKIDTAAYFPFAERDKAEAVCDALNEKIWGHSEGRALQIIGRSMRMTA